MRLAVTVPCRVVPPVSGGRRLVSGACRRYAEVTDGFQCLALATLNDRGRPSAPFPYLERKTVASLLCGLDRLGLAPKVPYLEAMRLYLPWLAREALRISPDVVEVHMPWLMGIRRHLPETVKVVLVMQNVESVWYEPLIRARPGAALFRCRLSTLEREGVELADHVVCLTPEDRETLLNLYGGGGDRFSVIPPGADVPETLPPAPVAATTIRRAVFVGSGFSGNLESARRLLAAVGPVCGDRMELSVVGDVCAELTRDPLPRGVHLLGNVPDCSAVFAASDVLLNPGGSGSGIHIKVIDALAMGCRVVSTPGGGRGYAGLADGPIRLGELSEFAGLALGAERLTAAEFRRVRAYSWAAIVQQRLALYARLCGRPPEGGP